MLNLHTLYMNYQRLNDEEGVRFSATRQPVFSWSIDCGNTEERQQSFTIAISTDDADFNYQKTIETSEQRFQYDGPALPLGQKLNIEIKIQTQQGEYSLDKQHFFVTCLEKWPANWICVANKLPREQPLYFRKPFKVNKKLKHAMLYICGIGYHRVWLNGKPITANRPLDPAVTDYSKRCLYVAYPISANDLDDETNCLGVEVGLGWRDNANLSNPNSNAAPKPFRGDPCLTAYLIIYYSDGSFDQLMTDDSWECGVGPMVYADIFNGCKFDERLNNPDWCSYHFQSKSLSKAAICQGPGGKMEPAMLSPIVGHAPICPVAKWQLGQKWIYDFGQNIAGVIKFDTLYGLKENETLTVRHSEELDENGDLFTATLRTAKATDVYVSDGNDCHSFMPYFTYHGFRYASIEAPEQFMVSAKPKAIPLRNSLDKKNFFHCGDPTVNAIMEACVNTERANIHNLLTDCPQRDERQGWLNDATVRFEAFPYSFESNQIFRKVTRDVIDTQDENGGIADTAPFVWGGRPADPVCSSFIIAGWQNYLFDGDDTILREAFPNYCAWAECLLNHRDENGIVNYSHWGDWAGPAYVCKTPDGAHSLVTNALLVSTGFLYYDCKLIAEIARVLGKEAEAAKFDNLKTEVAKAILDKWYDKATKKFDTGSQGAQSLMLWLGIFPEEDIPDAVNAMASELRESNYKFTTGNLCTRYLHEMLIKYGHVDDAWNLLTKHDYPSYGYMLQQEATTIWERFEQKLSPGMNSHNHPMYASISYVLYAYYAGIRPLAPGFRRILIQPYFPTRLQSLQTRLETAMGEVGVHWFKRYGKLNLHVTVPFGATAEVAFDGKVAECAPGFHTFSASCNDN